LFRSLITEQSDLIHSVFFSLVLLKIIIHKNS